MCTQIVILNFKFTIVKRLCTPEVFIFLLVIIYFYVLNYFETFEIVFETILNYFEMSKFGSVLMTN